ncbi:MAG TPA: adenine deaminase C-terminal domain-containing protein [Syntrophorhabdaceae bacterium]|nr:adenine deaminase C-terminal domain-containing protein [Syntrophorhabdaceae bacterium]
MRKQIKTLLDVVKGIKPPDTIITNAKIVNVFTDSIDEGQTIVIKDGMIASVEQDSLAATYKPVRTIDANGFYLCPGFIDAHTHIDGIYPFREFVPYCIRGGTTTVVTETSAACCAAGMKGIRALIAGMKDYPVRAFFLAPPLTPPFPKLENSLGLNIKEFTDMLRRDDCVGIGEAYWTRVVDADKQILDQISAALSLNKRLDGHAAGARGKKLIEYALTGITSCHESISMEELVEKLKIGMYVMIREGSIRQELPELSKIKDLSVDTRRIILVSDVFDAIMLTENGYLDFIGRKANQFGVSPLETIKMMTINPADYYGLRYLGAIAPLRYADILFLSDLERITIEKVMSNGEIVFESGAFKPKLRRHTYPEKLKHTIRNAGFRAEDFRIPARTRKTTVRVIEIVNPTITKETHAPASLKDGFVEKDLNNDIIPVAMINRRNPRCMGKGLIKGTGIKSGAVSTTLTWDTGNILVIGSSEENMAAAVNRLVELQGGIVIVKNGKIIYEFQTELFGLMPLMPMTRIAGKIRGLEDKLASIGAQLQKPFLNIQTIPFTGLPYLRITDKGLANVKQKRLVPLFVD